MLQTQSLKALAIPTPGATWFGTNASEVINVLSNPRAGFKYTDGLGGNDTMNGTADNDGIIGNTGNDKLYGNNGNDVLSGGAGKDVLDGGAGSDTASYYWDKAGVTVDLAITTAQDTKGAGVDTITNIENLTGTLYADRLSGTDGANVISGQGGNDYFDTRGGNDTIQTGGGNDTVLAGDGNDLIQMSGGADKVDGGAGVDTLDFTYLFQALTIDLANTAAQPVTQVPGQPAVMSTITNMENILGSQDYNNILSGNDAANAFTCNNYDSFVWSSTAQTYVFIGTDDVLNGRGGNDTLDAGAGNDSLTGGSGADTFIFNYATTGQHDQITDFSTAEGDKIVMHTVFTGVAAAPVFSAAGAFSHLAGEVIVTGSAAAQQVQYDGNGDGIADCVIDVSAAQMLTATDFVF